jgi:hypothetical protein
MVFPALPFCDFLSLSPPSLSLLPTPITVMVLQQTQEEAGLGLEAHFRLVNLTGSLAFQKCYRPGKPPQGGSTLHFILDLGLPYQRWPLSLFPDFPRVPGQKAQLGCSLVIETPKIWLSAGSGAGSGI